jgi:photosystem II stability/assembly factor-like uncharacterized protein
MKALAAALLLAGVPSVFFQSPPRPAPRWTSSATGVTARLRGVSAVSDRVVWASGTAGTVIRTADGGATWRRLAIADAEKLDFRDIDAADDRTAYVLSIGAGDASRIYKTTDAGATWQLQFRNEDPKAFFDAMVFSNARTGYALSDSVDGHFVLIRTTDGRSWARVPAADLPPARDGEGAYAASGTNLAVERDAIWFATTSSRVIRSTDRGRTWTAAETPLPSSASAGIFSIAFRDPRHGIVVGGDYKNERGARDTGAVTDDGGATWTAVNGLGGFRSAVGYAGPRRTTVVAVGPSGSDYSDDGGRTWRTIEGPGFHTLSVVSRTGAVWAAGDSGAVGRLQF